MRYDNPIKEYFRQLINEGKYWTPTLLTVLSIGAVGGYIYTAGGVFLWSVALWNMAAGAFLAFLLFMLLIATLNNTKL